MIALPYTYFGGKSQVADVVWSRLGDCASYRECFYGGGAIHILRPGMAPFGDEVINDINGYVTNFWRAVKADWRAVAGWMTGSPPNEIDLEARHLWLAGVCDGKGHNCCDCQCARSRLWRLRMDATWYSAQMAGWWCWCSGIWWGDGLCKRELRRGRPGPAKLPIMSARNGNGITQMDDDERADVLCALANRMSAVKVACGDWSRILTDSAAGKPPIGVVLDPPYCMDIERMHMLARHMDNGLQMPHTRRRRQRSSVYASDAQQDADMLVARVHHWCAANGGNHDFRIALFGYDGEHDRLETLGWRPHSWVARGGLGNQNGGENNTNRGRERIWFSPGCVFDRGLFDEA